MPGLLCLLAHPDDETFCAGLLADLAARGVPVHLRYLTRGEGGTLGRPPVATRATLGAVREAEGRCAAEALGASSVGFLGYEDPVADGGPLREPAHDPAQLRADLRAPIQETSPEVVLTHGSNGEYGHPAHRLLHRAVTATVEGLGTGAPLLYTLNAFFPRAAHPAPLNPDDLAHIVLDVAPFAAVRARALLAHASQVDVFVGEQPDEAAYRRAVEAYVRERPREGYHRAWPLLRRAQQDTLTAWLGVSTRSRVSRRLTALHGRAWRVRRLASATLRRLRGAGMPTA